MTFSNQPVMPHNMINNAENMKAPTASGIDTLFNDVARSAAPGVDQAVIIGALYRNDNPKVVTAMPKPSAIIQEPTCSDVAPAARAAWKTITAELV